MRISDDRYQRDLRRLQLAWRMIQLGARTPTIERWTALSIYRIRKLRNEYAPGAGRNPGLKGVTPFRVEFFSKSSMLRCEAPLLAGFLRAFDVLPLPGELQPEELPSLARGERFCSAYGKFRCLRRESDISFEHAVTLLIELARGLEIRLAACTSCGGLVVHDCLLPRDPSCAFCLHESHPALPHSRGPPGGTHGTDSEAEHSEACQGSLF